MALVDPVVIDPKRKVVEIVDALNHKLTAAENLAPEGTAGQVLTSRGAGLAPAYAALPQAEQLTIEQVLAQLPNTVAYRDRRNTFTEPNTFREMATFEQALALPSLTSGGVVVSAGVTAVTTRDPGVDGAVIRADTGVWTVDRLTAADIDAGTFPASAAYSMSGLLTLSAGLTVSAGAVTFSKTGVNDGELYLRRDVGSYWNIWFQTGTSNRWRLSVNATAEGGANAGSDLEISRRADDGTHLGFPLTINRATGLVTLASGLTVSGGAISASGIATTVGALSATTGTFVHTTATPFIHSSTDAAGQDIYSLRGVANGLASLGQRVGTFGFGTRHTGTGAGRIGAEIQAFATAAWADGSSYPTRLEFYTVPVSSTTLTLRGTITAAGLLDWVGAGTFGGLLTTVASAAGGAGFRIPTGTAPSSPVTGDIWHTTAPGLFISLSTGTDEVVLLNATQTLANKAFSSVYSNAGVTAAAGHIVASAGDVKVEVGYAYYVGGTKVVGTQQTGVAVTAAAIHAALVTHGLITV